MLHSVIQHRLLLHRNDGTWHMSELGYRFGTACVLWPQCDVLRVDLGPELRAKTAHIRIRLRRARGLSSVD
jgi:hypothetical protein